MSAGFTLKEPVANYAAIATTYPTPTDKWAVQTLNDGKVYVYNASTSTWEYKLKMVNPTFNPAEIDILSVTTAIEVGSGNSFSLAVQLTLNDETVIYNTPTSTYYVLEDVVTGVKSTVYRYYFTNGTQNLTIGASSNSSKYITFYQQVGNNGTLNILVAILFV